MPHRKKSKQRYRQLKTNGTVTNAQKWKNYRDIMTALNCTKKIKKTGGIRLQNSGNNMVDMN